MKKMKKKMKKSNYLIFRIFQKTRRYKVS